jgi:hypothetical protein
MLAGLVLLSAWTIAPLALAGPDDDRARKTAGDSFLFSSAALGRIEAARAGAAPAELATAGRSSATAPAGLIHLSAIVYRAPGDWRVWLNGESFTPRARPGPIEIQEVSAERVVLAWRPHPGAHPVRVELRPNQTFVVASGAVLEGSAGARR